MMKQTSLALAMFAMPLVVIAQSGQGSGQQDKTGQDKTGQDKAGQDKGQPGQAPGQPGQAPGQAGAPTQRALQFHRSDDVIGADVKNAQGETIGSLEDVFISSGGEANYAVLSCEGEGKGKLVVVPLSMIRSRSAATPADPAGKPAAGTGQTGGAAGRDTTGRPTTAKANEFTLMIDKERLRSAPSFEENDWPKGAEVAAHFDEVDRYFRNETSMTGRPISASVRGPSTTMLRATKLEGRNLENASGEKIGDIQQIVFDNQNGRVAYVAVSMGGFLGVGDKLVAVPWEAINVRAPTGAAAGGEQQTEKLILETSKDKLNAAPEFKSGDENWREMSDPNWVGRVYSHFSVRPYWQQGSTSPSQPPPKDG